MITLQQISELNLPPATKKFMKEAKLEIFSNKNKTTMNIVIDRDSIVLISVMNVLYNAIFTQLDEEIKINAYDSKNELIAELK